MRRIALLLFFVLTWLRVGFTAGQGPSGLALLPAEVANTARRINAADKLAAQKQWSEAVDEYQRILSEAGDDLVPVLPRHVVQARWVCQARLAALPMEQRKAYRARIDSQAKKWFDPGAAQRDARLLRRVVEEAFCSGYGERALDMLGDLAFERGRFEEANRWWTRIIPPIGSADGPKDEAAKSAFPALLVPDPQLDPARVRAKQLLARLFSGEARGHRERLEEALQAFRKQHGDAKGRFAGRQGLYADILQALLVEMAEPIFAEETAAWPTFAGGPQRGGTVSGARGRLRRMCFRPPQWRFSLENHARLEPDAPSKVPENTMTPSARARAMAFYPVIAGDHVVVADARYVVAYALQDGSASVWYDAARDLDGLDRLVSLKLPAPADLRYSLTVADDRVYARMGVQDITPDRSADGNPSSLVCLNLKADDKDQRLRWQTAPDEPKPGAVFEGAPLVHDGRVYIAATRIEGGRTITAIHCYPADADGAPRALWRRDICSTQELHPKEGRFRHHLLTLGGSRIVYCSHSGAVVALEADTGRPAWAVRYPSRGGTTQAQDATESSGTLRDLAPCIYAAGRLYVAPNDYDRVLCLDAATGETLWERGAEVVHLLGVARGKLVLTTRNTLRAVDAITGENAWQMPDAERLLVTQARGLIADDVVFWPTKNGMVVLRVDDGLLASDFPPDVLADKMTFERTGNMAYADGCLVVAGLEELDVYLAPGRQRADREAEVKMQPSSPSARMRLAFAEADAGLGQQAVDTLRRAEDLAGSAQPALAAQARAMRHELLLELAAKNEAARQWDQAAAWLEAAAASEFAPTLRGQAKARLAILWEQAGQWGRAVAAWQAMLDDQALRDIRLDDAKGNPQQASIFAKGAIDRLIRARGRDVYSAIEKRAQERLEDADQDRLDQLRRLARQFPNAAATSMALRELAQSEERAGRLGAAAHAYRAFLRRAPEAAEAPPARAALARIYDQERLWDLARATRRESAPTVGETIASNQLFPADGDRSPAVQLPLLRAWDMALESEERLLLPDVPHVPGIPDEWLFFAAPRGKGGRLTCRESSTGKACWTTALPFVPSWVGCHADTVLAGGEYGVTSFRLADGHPLWGFTAARSLSAFHLPGPYLFFLEEERRLYALDAETGEALWTRWAPAAQLHLPEPSGRFNPHYFAGSDRLVVQTGGGRLWLLEAATGRLIQDASVDQRQWSQPPRVLNNGRKTAESVYVATGPHRVARLDSADGKELWRYECKHATSLTGELPQWLGDSAALFFLLIPRNYGTVLQRLDLHTGTALWKEERLLATESLSADQVAFDPRALYFVANNVLQAHGLNNGQTLWALPLAGPRGRWQTRLAGQTLIVSPADVPVTGFSFRLISNSLQWMAVSLSLLSSLPEMEHPAYPIALVDSLTGQLMERLNFPLDGSRTMAQKMPGVPRRALVLHICRDGLIAAVPGRASRLITIKDGD